MSGRYRRGRGDMTGREVTNRVRRNDTPARARCAAWNCPEPDRLFLVTELSVTRRCEWCAALEAALAEERGPAEVRARAPRPAEPGMVTKKGTRRARAR